jgi:hypothetical protein
MICSSLHLYYAMSSYFMPLNHYDALIEIGLARVEIWIAIGQLHVSPSPSNRFLDHRFASPIVCVPWILLSSSDSSRLITGSSRRHARDPRWKGRSTLAWQRPGQSGTISCVPWARRTRSRCTCTLPRKSWSVDSGNDAAGGGAGQEAPRKGGMSATTSTCSCCCCTSCSSSPAHRLFIICIFF